MRLRLHSFLSPVRIGFLVPSVFIFSVRERQKLPLFQWIMGLWKYVVQVIILTNFNVSRDHP